MPGYKTIEKSAQAEFTVKRSRFIGYISPVKTQQEATDFIAAIRSKHWDATHNVYAYILREGQSQRYSDDGEPQGTAGIPTLDVLQKEGLTDCACVVTRYFGGILLGGGGLVRAYSHSAKLAVDAGGIIAMALCGVYSLKCDYGFYGRLDPLIHEHGGTVENTDFSDSVEVTFSLPTEIEESFSAKLFDSSFGKYKIEKMCEKFLKI